MKMNYLPNKSDVDINIIINYQTNKPPSLIDSCVSFSKKIGSKLLVLKTRTGKYFTSSIRRAAMR